MCSEAGLSPSEYLDMTVKEIVRFWDGYCLRNTRLWEMTRMQVYTFALPYMKPGHRVDLWDFMPLSTDPTAEERAVMQEQQKAAVRAEAEKAFEYYRSRGFNV